MCSSDLTHDIFMKEFDENPGLRKMIQKFGMPPIVITDKNPSLWDARSNRAWATSESAPEEYGKLAGFYHWIGGITLREDHVNARRKKSDLLIHELGHAWHHQAMKSGLGERFNFKLSQTSKGKLWDEDIESAKKISNYATTNAKEWLAEAMPYILSGDKQLIDEKIDDRTWRHVGNLIGINVDELKETVGYKDSGTTGMRSRVGDFADNRIGMSPDALRRRDEESRKKWAKLFEIEDQDSLTARITSRPGGALGISNRERDQILAKHFPDGFRSRTAIKTPQEKEKILKRMAKKIKIADDKFNDWINNLLDENIPPSILEPYREIVEIGRAHV